MENTSKKSGSTFLTVLAVIFAVLFVITLPEALLAYDTGQVVFNPPVVTRIISKELISSSFFTDALTWFSEQRAEEREATVDASHNSSEPDILQLFSVFPPATWSQIRSLLLPDELLNGWVSSAVNDLYAWIDSHDLIPQIEIEMTTFKNLVNSEQGVKAVKTALDSLPPCTAEQLADFNARLKAAPEGADVAYNPCKFPEPYYTDQANDYVTSIDEIVRNVPDLFSPTQVMPAGDETEQAAQVEQTKATLRTARSITAYAWALPLALLAFILLLAIRSLKSLGRLWGIPFLIGGVISLVPVFTYPLLINKALSIVSMPESEFLASMARVMVKDLLAAVFQPMMIQAIVLAVAGIILIVVGETARRKA